MPLRLVDLIAHLETHGVRVEKPGKGSHYKAKKDGFRTFPIPAHNGPRTEITDPYVRSSCKHFGIPMP